MTLSSCLLVLSSPFNTMAKTLKLLSAKIGTWLGLQTGMFQAFPLKIDVAFSYHFLVIGCVCAFIISFHLCFFA